MLYECYDNKEFTFGDEVILLDYLDDLSPSDAVALLDDIDITGLKLWEGSVLLAEFVSNNVDLFKGKSVLELGTGVGLSGILASRFAKEVVLTDKSDDVLKLTMQNVANNIRKDDPVSCEVMCWGDHLSFKKQHSSGFDVIMGGDLIYSKDAIVPLLQTASDLLSPKGIFIVLYVDRFISNFAMKMEEVASQEPFYLECEEILLKKNADEGDAYVLVFRNKE